MFDKSASPVFARPTPNAASHLLTHSPRTTSKPSFTNASTSFRPPLRRLPNHPLPTAPPPPPSPTPLLSQMAFPAPRRRQPARSPKSAPRRSKRRLTATPMPRWLLDCKQKRTGAAVQRETATRGRRLRRPRIRRTRRRERAQRRSRRTMTALRGARVKSQSASQVAHSM